MLFTTFESYRTSPSEGLLKPARIENKDVLPAPFGPSKPNIVSEVIEISMLSRIFTLFETFLVFSPQYAFKLIIFYIKF